MKKLEAVDRRICQTQACLVYSMDNTALPSDLKEHRTLAAIVFTDGVNFSALMSKNEEHTLVLIRRDLQMMTELCQHFEGRVLKSTGDGLLMYFTSAVQAVACALEIQNQLAQTAAHLSANDVLKHRIGIHLGDVFFTQNDVMGNGVNVAARLQTVAKPGGICISQTVYDVVKNGLNLQATYLGQKELKNIQDAVPVYQILLASPTESAAQKQVSDPKKSLNREEYRNRQILLNKVKNYWIKGVLETSLHGRASIELGLQERLDAVDLPWDLVWETPDGEAQILPPGTKVIDKFNELGEGRSLLILGDPGSGKTTTLLELARDLIVRAERDMTQSIPVVFNLSSWIGEKQNIADWLIQELHTKYQVSKEIGKDWLNNQQLLVMLDGLDEVSADRRDACVRAINQFSQEYGQTEMIVCSRIRDYEALSYRLKLQGAICLQPLSLEQIHQYLHGIGAELAAIRTALEADTTLQDLVRSPLMLSIMTLAYQGKSIEDLPQINSIEERRKHLFNAYIDRMFKRRIGDRQYSKEQAKRWLVWLAQKMVKQSQSVFVIERLQPTWLANNRQRWIYCIYIGAIAGLSFGLGGGLNIGLLFEPMTGLMAGLVLGLGAGLIAVLLFGLVAHQINPVETLKWSSIKAINSLSQGLAVGLISGPIFGLSFGIYYDAILKVSGGMIYGLIYGLILGLGVGLVFVLLHGLRGPGIEMTTVPNQGIWQSAKNAMFFATIGATGLGLMCYVAGTPIILGLTAGLLFGMFGAGEACLQHFALRAVLFHNGYIPWNYARFLDWATERIFLQKVGGGYIFIHRLLLEHFAQM